MRNDDDERDGGDPTALGYGLLATRRSPTPSAGGDMPRGELTDPMRFPDEVRCILPSRPTLMGTGILDDDAARASLGPHSAPPSLALPAPTPVEVSVI